MFEDALIGLCVVLVILAAAWLGTEFLDWRAQKLRTERRKATRSLSETIRSLDPIEYESSDDYGLDVRKLEVRHENAQNTGGISAEEWRQSVFDAINKNKGE